MKEFLDDDDLHKTQDIITELAAVINRQPKECDYPGIQQMMVTALIVCAGRCLHNTQPEHHDEIVRHFQHQLATYATWEPATVQ